MGKSYYETILPFVAGRSVLDIGSIAHSYPDRNAFKPWHFAKLASAAARIRGIDLLEADVKMAQADGYDIVHGNAETFIDGDKFDVVYAGDPIQHSSNPGQFLACANKT